MIREVREESGIEAYDPEFVASQPWPFPSSLMIGCIADALDETIVIDPVELADARWFSREAVAAMIAGNPQAGLRVPPPMALAHTLTRAGVEERG